MEAAVQGSFRNTGPADGQVPWRPGTRGDGITSAEAADRLVERRLADAAAWLAGAARDQGRLRAVDRHAPGRPALLAPRHRVGDQLARVRRPGARRRVLELEETAHLPRRDVDDGQLAERSRARLEGDELAVGRPAEHVLDPAGDESSTLAAPGRDQAQRDGLPGEHDVGDFPDLRRPQRMLADFHQPPEVAAVRLRRPDAERLPGVVGRVALEHDLRSVGRETWIDVVELLP